MEDFSRAIIEIISEACFIIQKKPKKIIINQKLIQLFKYNSEEDLLGHINDVFELFEKKEESKVKKDIMILIESGKIRTHQYKFVRKDGTFFKAKVSFKTLYSPNSKQLQGYFGIISDIKRNGVLLNRIKKKFYNIYNDTNDLVVVIDFKGNILTANQKLFDINFFADKSIRNYNIFDLIDKDFQKVLHKRLEQLHNGKHTIPTEYKLINSLGKSAYVEVNIQPTIYHNQKAILTRIKDISTRKEVEQKMLETIIKTEEKERQRFAEDLHDELGPFLSGIKLYIDELESPETKGKQRKKMIEYLNEMVDEAILKTRTISNNLMPNVLVDYGLNKAIKLLIGRLNTIQQTKIELDFIDFEEKLDKALEINIYRILIELINNSLKHANPNNIFIGIKKENSTIKTLYKDDGKGFNLDIALKLQQGIGLSSIINRLKSMQAFYTFSSNVNEGMQFEFSFPLN